MTFKYFAASVFALSAACAALPPAASAQTILSETFQDGNADGWAAEKGKGDIRLTTYQGNVSLQMTRNAYALRRIDGISAPRVSISASFAADGLEGEDACKLEASADGKTWIEIGRVVDGQDDGVTLHTLSGTLDINGTLFLGLRTDGNAKNDICWADNITVTGMRIAEALGSDIPQDVLWGGARLSEPLSMAAFTPPAPMNNSTGVQSGTLSFSGAKADHFELLLDKFKYAETAANIRQLPPFSIDLAVRGNDIIPVQRGPQPVDHPDWEWILEPGNIWQSANGNARVSLPFALQERNANCVHNGVMAFEINASGKTSALVYQIGSETCSYTQFNMWGSAPAGFTAKALPNTAAIISAYDTEKSARLHMRPIGMLPGAAHFGAPDDVPPASMTAYGYVDGQTHYVGGCNTRFGAYPFCDVMGMPSYSWAKSMVAGMAAMRLEKLYPGAMQSKVADYVPACKKWKDVTIEHALDMATGVYTSKVYDVDEASPANRKKFFMAERHKDKIKAACTIHKRREAPGQTFVYHTTDTYIVGAAITEYLRRHTGDPKADIFETLVKPIFAEIGVSPTGLTTRRTYDEAAQPYSGWGLTLHRNDIALIMNFLQGGGNGLLDADMLASAMQQNPNDRGLTAVIDSQRYQNGFWAWNADPSIGCKTDVFIPIMSGFGGLTAAMMPNGHSYYFVSDGGAFKWARAAKASNAIKPFCEVIK